MDTLEWGGVIILIVFVLVALIMAAVALANNKNVSTCVTTTSVAADVYAHVRHGVAVINAMFADDSSATASGFIIQIDKQDKSLLIVTAAHAVLEGAGLESNAVESTYITAALMGSKTNIQRRCAIVAVHRSADLALLRMSNVDIYNQFTALSFRDSDQVAHGAHCYVVGNPLGSDFFSISSGLVRDNTYVNNNTGGAVESLYISTPAISGISGSPVFDVTGSIIGMVNYAQQDNQSTVLECFSGGVNSHLALRIIDRMLTQQNQHGFIGVTASQVVAGNTFNALGNVTSPNGILVTQTVTTEIVPGDIIMQINGRSIGPFDNDVSPTRFTFVSNIGTNLEVVILRAGATIEKQIILGSIPSEYNVVFSRAF